MTDNIKAGRGRHPDRKGPAAGAIAHQAQHHPLWPAHCWDPCGTPGPKREKVHEHSEEHDA